MKNYEIDHFINFLGEQGTLDAFRKNLATKGYGIKGFCRVNEPADWVLNSFDWHESPQGYGFWSDVQVEWVKVRRTKTTPTADKILNKATVNIAEDGERFEFCPGTLIDKGNQTQYHAGESVAIRCGQDSGVMLTFDSVHIDNISEDIIEFSTGNDSDDRMYYKAEADMLFDIGEAHQPTTPTADKILNKAASHIADRASQRDAEDGERSMSRCVAAFNALEGVALTEAQGWRFMAVLKMARATAGGFNIDDYEDGAAYMALCAECLSGDEE